MTHTVKTTVLSLAAFLSLLSLPCAGEVPGLRPGVPSAHTNRMIEGWTVRVDDRLLKGEGTALGERALKLLTARLVAITTVVPEKALTGLRAVKIELDLDYPGLGFMQYHPDVGWLKEQGYSEDLAKCVHIPDVEDFLSPFENHRMPWVVLHELTHGYHDQVMGYDEPRIKAAWKKFRDGGKYQSVLTNRWGMHKHYALTNQMEFFAEMTESYFGSNDFYPSIFDYDTPGGTVRAFYQVLMASSDRSGYFETFMGTEGTIRISEQSLFTNIVRDYSAQSWDPSSKQASSRKRSPAQSAGSPLPAASS